MKKMNGKFLFGLTVMVMMFIAGCMPSTVERSNLSAPSTTTTGGSNSGSGNGTTVPPTTSFPFPKSFFQESGVQSDSTLNILTSFSDSFLIRGQSLSTYLATINISSKLCFVVRFPQLTGNKVAVLSAKIQSYNNLALQTTEYYLRVQPNNTVLNQSDCLSAGMLSMLNADFASPTPAYGISAVCSTCVTNQVSEGLKLYSFSGIILPQLNFDHLKIQVQPSGTTSSNICVSNSACMAQGYTCCLQGQCVQDGSVKNGVDTSSPGYLSAQNDVLSNPMRFTLYPDYYYICGTGSGIGTGTGNSDPTDPNYAAVELFKELQDLYTCLNPQLDEISYCPVKTTNAAALINPNNLATPPGATFFSGFDDINFSVGTPSIASSIRANNIYEIRYGGQLIYQESTKTLETSDGNLVPDMNDNLLGRQSVFIKKALPANALDSNLILKYKIDGSCERLSTNLARCSKTYIQGQSSTPPKPSDHPSGQTFRLPDYADMSYSIIVKVGESIISQGPSTWSTSGQNIIFSSGYPIFPNQKVSFQYYVTANVTILTQSRFAAQDKINTYCGCQNVAKCNLAPVTTEVNGVLATSNFICSYPQPTGLPTTPFQQTVYVSAKSVPYRYFDGNGVSYEQNNMTTAPAQELLEFRYTNNNPATPNNTSSFIGFNEIYGSFNKTSNQPKPPVVLEVTKDKNYDIFVDQGGFSTCTNCGGDYYNLVQKIFPNTFGMKGAGYRPDLYNSSRTNSTGEYRSDDLLFGRACFLPATMIPWTHTQGTDVATQRRNRLSAQHFLFSNGYNRDWFGFDYGSLIGSFDGVTWFAIGNQRKIKANSRRLYLAVNSYFGDLTLENSFTVTVSETLAIADSGSNVSTDSQSDGAECQKQHFCSTDNDCIRQIGYEYTCQNVSSVQTNWPIFDALGAETIGSQVRTISSIIGGLAGQTKRCVYRGRGAPCEQASSPASPYTNAGSAGMYLCSTNNYCAPLSQARFNDRIARFAVPPVSQNLQPGIPATDTIGQGARILGRPYKYYGDLAPGVTITSQLASNNIDTICIPGKNPTSNAVTTYTTLSNTAPTTSVDSADRIFGLGITGTTQSPRFYMGCAATDSAGNYFSSILPESTFPATSASSLVGPAVANNILRAHVSQSLSASYLNNTTYGVDNNIQPLVTTSSGTVTAQGYQPNACLRSPGSACFSDSDCAASPFIASRASIINNWGIFANNPAEQAFWKEEMTCGNPEPKKLNDGSNNPLFILKNNKCCRGNGKTLTVMSQKFTTDTFQTCSGSGELMIPGVNMSIGSPLRNPRNHVGADKISCYSGSNTNPEFPALISPAENPSTSLTLAHVLKQYKTLDLMNQRMCCTGNWVRSFSDDNGGGHKWGAGKIQNINKEIFKSIAWLGPAATEPFFCTADNAQTPACKMRNLSPQQAKDYLDWFHRFELVGIPQVLIPSPKTAANGTGVIRLSDDFTGTTGNQADVSNANIPIKNTMKPISNEYTGATPFTTTVNPDIGSALTSKYISAASYLKLEMGSGQLKKVFDENKFNCCLPTGQEVPNGTTNEMCCTGTVTNQGASSELRCCLPDLADVSVYLNRYVSSEGRGLSDSAYDPETGYIKEPGTVCSMQVSKSLCCSGKAAYGYAISDLPVPTKEGGVEGIAPGQSVKRFLYSSGNIDSGPASLFDAGLRWNNHVYCLPQSSEVPDCAGN